LLRLPDLTDDQLDEALGKLIIRFLRDDGVDKALTHEGHTHKLLALAKSSEHDRELELCCLFYMLWIEHRINLILRVILRRKNRSDKDAIAIIQKLSVREKLTRQWQLLGLESIPEAILADISIIGEFRNGFVHYKWQSFVSFENEDRTWQAIYRVDAIIAALRNIEEACVFYGQRHRFSESAARLKDT
jgi:hypothetical protein